MPRLTMVTESYRRCLATREFYEHFFTALSKRIPDVGRYFKDADVRILHAFLRKAITTSLMEAAGSPAAAKQLARVRDMHSQGNLDVPVEWFPLWLDSLLDAVKGADADLTAETEVAWREVMGRAVELVTPEKKESAVPTGSPTG